MAPRRRLRARLTASIAGAAAPFESTLPVPLAGLLADETEFDPLVEADARAGTTSAASKKETSASGSRLEAFGGGGAFSLAVADFAVEMVDPVFDFDAVDVDFPADETLVPLLPETD